MGGSRASYKCSQVGSLRSEAALFWLSPKFSPRALPSEPLDLLEGYQQSHLPSYPFSSDWLIISVACQMHSVALCQRWFAMANGWNRFFLTARHDLGADMEQCPTSKLWIKTVWTD
jgi:hypothetical protein